jgi:hypothetical protein
MKIKIIKPAELNDISKSPDREYMEECGKIDRNPPKEWAVYKDNPIGLINTEYSNFNMQTSKPEVIKALYRLSVACLNYWRFLKQ